MKEQNKNQANHRTSATTHVRIFDTTLRDGEQAPGNSMNASEKLRVAEQLARLNVDIIEAGFPASSIGDFESVQNIARQIDGPVICGLARANLKDIDRTWEAIADAKRARIHTFIATSEIHMQHKLRMSPAQVLETAGQAVARAASYTTDVEFSCEDATRSDPAFLVQVFQRAIECGATTLNVPDTVGYTEPSEYRALFEYLIATLKGTQGITFSAHCHDDLGLATANSLAALQGGARQIECTINGIGERAGNTALEEVVMALRTRQERYRLTTQINHHQLYATSRMICQITGGFVQANKAIVGANAFAHEAGIHQDGVLKNALTYEIMRPEDVGVPTNKLILGKHSGRHAFRSRLEDLGYQLSDQDLNRAFERFKDLADQKKDIFDEDLEAIVADEIIRVPSRFSLASVNVASGTNMQPSATVTMHVHNELHKASAYGDGPVDAALNAIKTITKTTTTMTQYAVAAISGGTDAQGEVTVRLQTDDGRTIQGQGSDTDIVVASAKAYIHALNKLAYGQATIKQLERVSGP